jgi:hypothetical protein
MATPSEKLAESLQILKEFQERGQIAIRSKELPRVHRERLLKSGFIRDVMKGWYIPSRPDETGGESTAWYASYWDFCRAYLRFRFGENWSLSPEQSLLLLVGNRTVPAQLLVRSPRARNQITKLVHKTSLLEVRGALPEKQNRLSIDGLILFSLADALIQVPSEFYRRYPTEARAALLMIRDASEILSSLLKGGHSVVAGRLAGAFRNLGRERIANDILAGMREAGYAVSENDPFVSVLPNLIPSRERSPYVSRIRLMWQVMREPILELFPKPLGLPKKMEPYINNVMDSYVMDAYHSLSIEGYRVSPELIERVRSGKWNPDEDPNDKTHRDAMAAKGYWDAFQTVQGSLKRILKGENPGLVVDDDHSDWYRKLFGASITTGLLKPSDLAGYRNSDVFIRRSMHVPPNADAVRDSMPIYFELLREEKEAQIRVVLGHFIFVYIHPYMDGNGRMGRFLMNAMLASGGYPWTVIPTASRTEYMKALEAASVNQDIVPFVEFLSGLVKNSIKGKAPSLPGVPSK